MKEQILKSKRVVLTRPDNSPLAQNLRELGAHVIELPLISVELGAEKEAADDVLANIACYEWMTFSSANGVRGFFAEFFEKYEDIRSIGPCRIACVGRATAEELKKFHIQTDVIPEVSTGDAMADAILAYETIENLNILCVTGNLSDGAFASKLEEKGRAIVDLLAAYKTSLVDLDPSSPAVRDFAENGADAIFFASGSAVESFAKNAAKLSLREGATHPKAFSIGPRCSEAMKKAGISVCAEAPDPSDVFEMLKGALA